MQAPPLPQPDSTSSPVWKPPESTDSPASRVVAVSALPTSAVLPRRTPMAAVSPAGSGSPAARPRMSMLPPSASTEASEMSTPTWVLPVNDASARPVMLMSPPVACSTVRPSPSKSPMSTPVPENTVLPNTLMSPLPDSRLLSITSTPLLPPRPRRRIAPPLPAASRVSTSTTFNVTPSSSPPATPFTGSPWPYSQKLPPRVLIVAKLSTIPASSPVGSAVLLALALNSTFSGPVPPSMLKSSPKIARLASSWNVNGAVPMLRTISTPSKMVMSPSPGAPAPGSPVVMRTLLPASSAALMSPSWMMLVATGSKGLVGSVPAPAPETMSTSYGSISQVPALPLGALASMPMPRRSTPPPEVSMKPPSPPLAPPRARRSPKMRAPLAPNSSMLPPSPLPVALASSPRVGVIATTFSAPS